MKTTFSTFAAISTLLLLVSCGDGDGGSGEVSPGFQSAYSCNSSFKYGKDEDDKFTVTGEFCDNNVTFQNTSYVLTKPSFKMRDIWNNIIPYAFASNEYVEPVSCVEGQSMTIAARVLRNKDVTLSINCSEDMDNEIRAALASKAVEDETLIAEYDDGLFALEKEIKLDIPGSIVGEYPNVGPVGDVCRKKFTFDDAGNVTIELDTDAVTDTTIRQNCFNREGKLVTDAGTSTSTLLCQRDRFIKTEWVKISSDILGEPEAFAWEPIYPNEEVEASEPNKRYDPVLSPCDQINSKKVSKYRYRDGFIEIDKEAEWVMTGASTYRVDYKFSDGVDVSPLAGSNSNRFRLNKYSRYCIKGAEANCDKDRYFNFVKLPETGSH